MKKLVALLLACMMLLTAGVAMAEETEATASVYSTLKFDEVNKPVVKHKLTLTDVGLTTLPYDITYQFTVEDPEVIQPENIADEKVSYMVTGKPVISDLLYDAETTTFDSNYVSEKDMSINWSNVTFKEPGLYRWKVNKTYKYDGPEGTEGPTNNQYAMYLYVLVIDHNGSLAFDAKGLSLDAELKDKATPSEQFPAKTLSLAIEKKVQGNQGSRDQYFKFTISLNAPTGSATDPYSSISGYIPTVPETAYNATTVNAQTRKDTNTGATIIEVWLKHDDKVTIDGLLYGTSYTITESENAGYDVTHSIAGDQADTVDGATASDTSLEQTSTVTFTNEKIATVPTGIDLQTGAPIMGLLLAAAMMLMLTIGKRKEAAE